MLLVEDDEDLRTLYAWCMRAAGWTVVEAANGREAIIAADDVPPDVVVLDVRMPLLGGLEVLALMKSSEALGDVPILVCTGCDDPQVEAMARAGGCDEFVRKPCEPEALRDALAELLPDR